MKLLLAASLLGLVASSAVAQSRLPQCPSAKVAWTNCQGTLTWADGSKYVGEFRDGKMNGQGTLTADGNEYIGEFRDGRQNGQGTLTWADGRKYVGEFRDGKSTGRGTMFAADGSREAAPTLGGTQPALASPPSADYIKAQIAARYEQCHKHAVADYTARWNYHCYRIQEREQRNYENCLVNLQTDDRARNRKNVGFCDGLRRTTQDCQTLPVSLADSLTRDYKDAEAQCVKGLESGLY